MDFRFMGFDNDMMRSIQHVLDIADESEKHTPSKSYVRDTKAMAATPADIKEYPNSYVFIIDMPGVKPTDISVQVEDNVLQVSGERKREDKDEAKFVKMERRQGKFMRKFVLAENANPDGISATYENGVLTVTVEKLPPPEPKKSKNIQVKVA